MVDHLCNPCEVLGSTPTLEGRKGERKGGKEGGKERPAGLQLNVLPRWYGISNPPASGFSILWITGIHHQPQDHDHIL